MCVHVHVCERECPCVCVQERGRESLRRGTWAELARQEMLGGSVGSRGPMQPMSAPYRMPCSSLEFQPLLSFCGPYRRSSEDVFVKFTITVDGEIYGARDSSLYLMTGIRVPVPGCALLENGIRYRDSDFTVV